VSVDRLSEDGAARFAELRVFPPDETVPEDAAVTLWRHTGSMRERYARRLLTTLARRALVQVDGMVPNRRVSLHDLVRDYMVQMAPDERALHGQVVDAYHAACSGSWATGPDDGYFFAHLARHLDAAGRTRELGHILLDFAWLDARLRATDVPGVVLDFAYLPGDHPAVAVGRAIRQAGHILQHDPSQLPEQLLARLDAGGNEAIAALLAGARTSKEGAWLRPIGPSTHPSEALLHTLRGHEDLVWAVAATDDGCAVSASEDHTLRVWDLASGQELHTLRGHEAEVLGVAVTGDARALSASVDNTLRIWNLMSGEEVHTLRGHENWVNAVAVTADGRAVSASQDRTLRVWDLASGREIARFDADGWMLCVAVHSTGGHTVAGDGTGAVHTLDSWMARVAPEAPRRHLPGRRRLAPRRTMRADDVLTTKTVEQHGRDWSRSQLDYTVTATREAATQALDLPRTGPPPIDSVSR